MTEFRNKEIYFFNVLGTYYGPDSNGELELMADGVFVLKTDGLQTKGAFRMDTMDEITFEKWGGNTAQGSFKGNVLTDPDGSDWIKVVKKADVTGTYYLESDSNSYLELKKDGSLTGVFKSTIKANGTYTLDLYDMTLVLQDPTGIHPNEEMKVEFGGELPGIAHHILLDEGAGEAFIKKSESLTMEKYIQEESHGNNYLELKDDGSFYWQMDGQITSGLYLIDGNGFIFVTGRGGFAFEVDPTNNKLAFEGLDGLETMWLKQ